MEASSATIVSMINVAASRRTQKLPGAVFGRDKTPFAKDIDFVFQSVRLKGKKPLSASIMVQKYL